jgi:hypothetical protein
MSDFFASLIQSIQDGVKTATISHGDREFFTRQVFSAPKKPVVDTMVVATLTGLVDYIEANPDGWEMSEAFIHVEDRLRVKVLMQATDPDLVRPNPLSACCASIIGSGFEFGKWMSIETAVIELQSKFVSTVGVAEVLAAIGNIKDETVNQYSDDGVTQTVQTKQGVTRVANADLPSRVRLQPWRTFPEIEQPEGEYILRLRKNDREGLQCALFDANPGAWQVQAILRIAEYLKTELVKQEIPVIA